MKTCDRQSTFEYYKVCAESCRKEEERGGGSVQPGYSTCERVQEEAPFHQEMGVGAYFAGGV